MNSIEWGRLNKILVSATAADSHSYFASADGRRIYAYLHSRGYHLLNVDPQDLLKDPSSAKELLDTEYAIALLSK